MVKVFQRNNPPRVIEVFGTKIKIRIKKKLEADGHELLGHFLPEINEIHLLKGCEWRRVLFHELLHASLFYSGTNELIGGTGSPQEETCVLSIENALVPILFG